MSSLGFDISNSGYSSFFEGSYHYAMNGQEKEREITSGTYSAEFWMYESGLARRWNVDPMMAKYPWQSPYSAFNNCPILFADPTGLEGEPSEDKPFVPEGAPENPTEDDSYRDMQGRLWQWFKSEDGPSGWARLDGNLETVVIYPEDVKKTRQENYERTKRNSNSIMGQFFGDGTAWQNAIPSGHSIFYDSPEMQKKYGATRANHQALENFLLVYAGGSLAAPFVAVGAVEAAPFLFQAARFYHLTFGVNGGYFNIAWNYSTQSYVTGDWSLDNKSVTGLVTSGFLTYGTSIQGQIVVGAMDPWISFGLKGGSLRGTGYLSAEEMYRPSLQQTTILSLVGIMPPLMHHVPFTNSLFINQVATKELLY